MKGAVLYGPRDVRYVERDDPKIEAPTDAVLRLTATCVCGSDLWPYRGISEPKLPAPMGHEYCGIVEEVGRDVKTVKKGQFVVGQLQRRMRVSGDAPGTTPTRPGNADAADEENVADLMFAYSSSGSSAIQALLERCTPRQMS